MYARTTDGVAFSGLDDQFFNQDTGAMFEEVGSGDQFGTALAAWDFGGGERPDLAIGTPFEDIGDPIEPSADERDVGVVNVLYGADGGRLTEIADDLWHQGIGSILDNPEQNDHFGRVAY